MKLTILTEDQAKSDSSFFAEHGISVLIDAEKKILLDVGQSGAFIKNAEKLKGSLNDVDCVILSHGHYDHTGGLEQLKKLGAFKVIAHPLCFEEKYDGETYIGPPFSLPEMEKNFELIVSKKPLKISENILFLGEIPRENDFECKQPVGQFVENGKRKDDYVLDDSAIAIKTKKGLVIVTGCSHSGICNIVKYAKKVTGENIVYAVLGGFHLLDAEAPVEETITFFKEEKVRKLFPCHCTGLNALSRFHETFKIDKVCAGDVITL